MSGVPPADRRAGESSSTWIDGAGSPRCRRRGDRVGDPLPQPGKERIRPQQIFRVGNRWRIGSRSCGHLELRHARAACPSSDGSAATALGDVVLRLGLAQERGRLGMKDLVVGLQRDGEGLVGDRDRSVIRASQTPEIRRELGLPGAVARQEVGEQGAGVRERTCCAQAQTPCR